MIIWDTEGVPVLMTLAELSDMLVPASMARGAAAERAAALLVPTLDLCRGNVAAKQGSGVPGSSRFLELNGGDFWNQRLNLAWLVKFSLVNLFGA